MNSDPGTVMPVERPTLLGLKMNSQCNFRIKKRVEFCSRQTPFRVAFSRKWTQVLGAASGMRESRVHIDVVGA